MANVLYLTHRLPYPPDKGDKVRSYHLLRHLAARHRVFLGTFVDDPADEAHVDTVRTLCAGLHVSRLTPRWARIRSLAGLLTREALTVPYYRDRALQTWVDDTCRQQVIGAVVVFSSAMAQYVDVSLMPRTVVDFVDVDSAKWAQYAPAHRWPVSSIYRREARLLLDFERVVAARAKRSFFVTENEAELFRHLAPGSVARVEAVCNGVDADYFSPAIKHLAPFAHAERPIVFTGAMDYWPNVDAVTWFASEVFPLVRRDCPAASFWIVGRNPAPAVRALEGDGVRVTGTVPDVRPFLQHAAAVVAPLRVARGIQNKILEAMAMARPVVASSTCVGAIDAEPDRDLLAADSPADFARQLLRLLNDAQCALTLARAARQRVLQRYGWEAHLSAIDRQLAGDAPLERVA